MPTDTMRRISETIRVLASFSEHRIKIHFFHWQGRIYKVESMNMFHIERDGKQTLYHFAVSVAGNSYELTYNPSLLEWRLEEIVEQ